MLRRMTVEREMVTMKDRVWSIGKFRSMTKALQFENGTLIDIQKSFE